MRDISRVNTMLLSDKMYDSPSALWEFSHRTVALSVDNGHQEQFMPSKATGR